MKIFDNNLIWVCGEKLMFTLFEVLKSFKSCKKQTEISTFLMEKTNWELSSACT